MQRHRNPMPCLQVLVYFVRQLEFQSTQITHVASGGLQHGFMFHFRMVDETFVAVPRLLAAMHWALFVPETPRVLYVIVELGVFDVCKHVVATEVFRS